jgi:hypothetical protein
LFQDRMRRSHVGVRVSGSWGEGIKSLKLGVRVMKVMDLG